MFVHTSDLGADVCTDWVVLGQRDKKKQQQ